MFFVHIPVNIGSTEGFLISARYLGLMVEKGSTGPVLSFVIIHQDYLKKNLNIFQYLLTENTKISQKSTSRDS